MYLSTRNDCEHVANSLNEAGISAVAYHAGLSDVQRTQCQEAWINNRYKVRHYVAPSSVDVGIESGNLLMSI